MNKLQGIMYNCIPKPLIVWLNEDSRMCAYDNLKQSKITPTQTYIILHFDKIIIIKSKVCHFLFMNNNKQVLSIFSMHRTCIFTIIYKIKICV